MINQPPPLQQYGLLWVATPSATFHAGFLDQHLNNNIACIKHAYHKYAIHNCDTHLIFMQEYHFLLLDIQLL